MIGVNQWGDSRDMITAVTKHVTLSGAGESVEKRIANTLLDDQTGARETDLAGVVEHGRRLFCREIEIGVGVDHEGAFAAEFRSEGHQVFRGGHSDHSTGRG